MTEQVPAWVLDPTPENLVAWLDEVHNIEIEPQYIDDETVQRIAKARTRDRTLDTLVALGERSIVDGSVMKVMTDASSDGTHHLTEGEWSTPIDWFLSKVEAGEWSEGMRYELQGVMNVVIPAFRAIGLSEEEIMKITENPTKARAAVKHIRPLFMQIQDAPDPEIEKQIKEIYAKTVNPEISTTELKNELSGYVPPEPIMVEEVWTDDNSSIVVMYMTDRVQRGALNLLLRKLPHELYTTDMLTLASNLLGPITEK